MWGPGSLARMRRGSASGPVPPPIFTPKIYWPETPYCLADYFISHTADQAQGTDWASIHDPRGPQQNNASALACASAATTAWPPLHRHPPYPIFPLSMAPIAAPGHSRAALAISKHFSRQPIRLRANPAPPKIYTKSDAVNRPEQHAALHIMCGSRPACPLSGIMVWACCETQPKLCPLLASEP